MTDTQAPRTTAGRKLLADEFYRFDAHNPKHVQFRDAILAIEAEATSPDVALLREALEHVMDDLDTYHRVGVHSMAAIDAMRADARAALSATPAARTVDAEQWEETLIRHAYVFPGSCVCGEWEWTEGIPRRAWAQHCIASLATSERPATEGES